MSPRNDRNSEPTYAQEARNFAGATRIKREAIVRKSDLIDYKNLALLTRCLGPQGQILSRRRTGLTAQRQRDLKGAIKRARHMGLLPFVG